MTGLGLTGRLASGAAACSGGDPRGPGGTQPRRRLQAIGLQLYSVRDEMARDFEGTLARLAAIGYREVEFAGYFDRNPEEVKGILRRYRLTAPSSHVPIEVVRRDWARTLNSARVIGHQYVTIPYLTPEDRRTPADFKRIAGEFNRLGIQAKRAGIRFAYHNHDFEFEPRGGTTLYEVLLADTDPDSVAFELDLMWISKAGADPLTYFARYPGRFEMVHVKDSTGAPDFRQVDVGRGTVDFGRILSRRDQAGIRHLFVEHDQPADPLGFARASYDYLARLELGG